MKLSDPVVGLRGVGANIATKLHVLGVKTVNDLVENFPRRYEDYSNITPIKEIQLGPVTIKGVIKQSVGRYVRKGLHITEAIISDDSGSMKLVWFNQPYRAAALKKGQEYFVSGEYSFKNNRLSITNPSAELVSSFPVNTARIIPIYRQTKGLKSNVIRKLVRQVFKSIRSIDEILPSWVLERKNLLDRNSAVRSMHFPDSTQDILAAQNRLGFDEVFTLSLAGLLNKQSQKSDQALKIDFDKQLAKEFVGSLPFELTGDQKRVAWQVFQDISKSEPANRLVEGDVGSGKTVVAAMAAAMAMKQGFSVAFMAPTEILARQHAETLHKLLSRIGMQDNVILLVGGLNATQKKTAQKSAKDNKNVLLVGTHALIQEKVSLDNLGLVIIDEQHRFGVEQRKALQKKAKHGVHTISLTATPIPRSLALTLYGELDISIIKEKPAKRLKVETKLVPQSSRPKLLQKVSQLIDKGDQVFWVCPLIEESDTGFNAKSVEDVYKELSEKHYRDKRVGILHGKMKSDEKDEIMKKFSDGELDILVSTTVIEVGVDIPNATVMVIESPERFGLAQLHQLRGRVGRGKKQSYCFLQLGEEAGATSRLHMLSSSNDGFKLAEYDLELRGPGAVYGTLQHGSLDLKVAKLSDHRLVASAREMAQEFIDKEEDLLKYKQLKRLVDSKRSITNLN